MIFPWQIWAIFIIFHRNLAAILGWLPVKHPVTMMPMRENRARSKTQIISDHKNHSVTISAETTTFAGDANLPLMSLTSPTDAASWGWRDDQPRRLRKPKKNCGWSTKKHGKDLVIYSSMWIKYSRMLVKRRNSSVWLKYDGTITVYNNIMSLKLYCDD